jgi:hypothetical protein
MSNREQRIAAAVENMINELGELRAYGIGMDAWPEELYNIRFKLHSLHHALTTTKKPATLPAPAEATTA